MINDKTEAVFFDVGNTLLFPNWQRILTPLAERGLTPSTEQIKGVERETKKEFDRLATTGSIDRDFWRLFYSRLLKMLRADAEQELVAVLTAATEHQKTGTAFYRGRERHSTASAGHFLSE